MVNVLSGIRRLGRLFQKDATGVTDADGQYKSRINTVQRISPDTVRKQAGAPFTRGDHHFEPRELLQREMQMLNLLAPCPYFPQVISRTEDAFIMNYAGEPVTRETLPPDWERQAEEILARLAEEKIIHRDIKLQNLLVKDGRLTLIDFGWAVTEDETHFPCPQDLCAAIPREMVYDNRYALYETIRKGLG